MLHATATRRYVSVIRRKAILVLPTIIFFVVLAAACDSGGDDGKPRSGESTTVATTTAATPSSATGTPSAGRVNVDAVTRAVQTRDIDGLVALVRYTEMPCISAPQGIGAPPLCASAGVPPGSTVETLPALLCEGEYLLKAVVPQFFRQLLLRSDLTYYGVLKAEGQPYAFPPDFPEVRSWPAPEHAVVFRTATAPAMDLGFYLRDGKVVALRSFGICGPQLPAPSAPAWLVPPRP